MARKPSRSQNPELTPEKLQVMNELLGAVIAISSQHDIADIAREACKQITHLLVVDSCAISNWDVENDSVKLWAETAITPEVIDDSWLQPFSLKDYPLTRFVLENNRAAQIRVDDPEGDEAEKKILEEIEVKSMLMLPLAWEDQVIGLAEVMDYERSRVFSDGEIALATLLLNQVGILINRAQILDEAKQRADELEALRQASFSLTTSEELEAVLKEVLQSTISLFPDAAGAYIYLFENGILTYESATLPNGEAPGAWADPHSNGLVINVANSGNMITVGDITEHPMFVNFPENNTGAVIGLPLKTGEQVVGVMVIRFKPRKFTEELMRILRLLGDQAAVAIERARTIHETKQRVFELEALRQTSLTLTSTLDLEEVLRAILKAVLYLSEDAMDAHLFLFENNQLSFGAALWADGVQHEPFTSVREDGLTYQVAREGKVIAIRNMQEHPLFTEKMKDDPDLWGGAIVGLPLKSGEDVVGVMNVAYRNPRDFTRDTLRVLGLLADQATLAIANAKLHQSISKQAQTDALTGLANRRAFNEYLEEEIKRSERYKRTFSIIMIDLDGFKCVNDTYGHLEGDNVLKEVANCLLGGVRQTDMLARWGGDEFIVLLPETDLKSAQVTAEKVINLIETHPFKLTNSDHQSVMLSMTAGVVNYPTHGESARELLYSADRLLYEGKARKVNTR